MVKTAIILAAGLGSRLGSKTEHAPKGFLEIDGQSLIVRSINNLIGCGIERIIIGTGYMSKAYEQLALDYPQIECVKNDIFATSGSMHTLYCLRNVVNEDFLILESDLLYDKGGLNILLEASNEDVILSSGKTNSNDEVYIEVDGDLNLVNMSKEPRNLGSIHSELVGITKISYKFYKKMCIEFEKLNNVKQEYEAGLVATSSIIPIKVLKIQDYVWCEIDDNNHLERAINKIYPKIKNEKKDV